MARSLVIVESPAKAKTINKYLGRNYTVKASYGHVMDLPKKNIGILLPAGSEPVKEPQVRVVPPRRRMERRQLQTDKVGKSPAALSGLVPAGPVAVSADEARKVQERSAPPPPTPLVEEVRSEIGSERSLGSLIQAFERRSGLSGIETPRT